MGNVHQITSVEEFNTLTQSGVVLVDFFATWCGPCKRQLPILEEVAGAFEGKAKVVKVDIEQLQDITAKFDVSSVPTLVLLNNGQMVDRFVGTQQESVLHNALANAAK